MKTLLFTVACFITTGLAAQNTSRILPKEIQIKTASLAAPEDLREGVKVYGYDQNGEFVVLREGTNHLICITD
ncbi:MAG: hypothetical protein R3209_03410, partial [Salinimicrobium sediminis]|nr:hypothetical protein [Salinimicrobium sediminis]